MLYREGKGRYQADYDALWDSLVPRSGSADTVQGELVRAIGRLSGEASRNGNANWDRSYRMLTNFLLRHLKDSETFDVPTIQQVTEDIEAIRGMGNGSRPLHFIKEEDAYDRITNRVVEWCKRHPTLIPLP